ncbi:MAG TPA: hypothetical protein VJ761_05020 [Ktedonobacteraceae bacterium]|nr:hypothetical protein [Ktedonobacteraceae bacterium]
MNIRDSGERLTGSMSCLTLDAIMPTIVSSIANGGSTIIPLIANIW